MRPLQAAVFVCSLSLFAASACALSTSSAACGVSAAPKFLPLPRCAPTNKTLDDAKRGALKGAAREGSEIPCGWEEPECCWQDRRHTGSSSLVGSNVLFQCRLQHCHVLTHAVCMLVNAPSVAYASAASRLQRKEMLALQPPPSAHCSRCR